MYEDLNQIAQLKFNKEVEKISKETREKVQEAQREYAARAGSTVGRSGQQEASIGRIQIDGAEQTVRSLFRIWVDLIEKRNGHVSRPDIAFLASKIDGYARTKKAHLHKAFTLQRRGPAINVLTQEAERSMYAVAASLRTDLEIMVREFEAFPNAEKKASMTQGNNRPLSDLNRVHPPTVAGPVFHGDQINNYGSIGAFGKGAQGVVNVYERSTDAQQQIDLQTLALELEQLRNEFRKTAFSREDDKQLALLGDAAEAAEKGDSRTVGSILSRVSNGVLELAKDLGTEVAAKVIVEMTTGS